MAPISGTYRLVSSDNLLAECEATFAGALSPADIKAIAAPDNRWTFHIKEKANGLIFKMEYSKTPQFNATYEYAYDATVTFPGCPGSSVMTKTGPSALNEVWSKADGSPVRSYALKFDAFGAVIHSSTSAGGVIATSIYERVNVPDFCGFYLLESHENVDAVMGLMSKDEVEQMLSYCAFRVTKSKDVYTATDYFGGGVPNKTNTFRIGEQQELGALDDLQMKDAVLLVTQQGPTTLSYLFKDRATGRIQAWTGEVTEDGFIWTVEAAAGVVTRMAYRRVGDLIGSWRMVVMEESDAYLDALGMPEGAPRAALRAERPTINFRHLGAGVWEYTSDQKLIAHEPVVGRMGEEWCLELGGLGTMRMVFNFTKDGLVGVKRLGDKVIASKFKILKDFATIEDSVVGVPGTTISSIFTRV